MDYPFHHRIKVRSYDMDSFGHVNNAVYFNYLEEARCEYMEQRGLSFNSFHEWGAFAFVIGAEIRYKAAAKYGDILDIRARFAEMKRSSFVLDYEIYNETTNKVCALAKMSFAFVNGNEKLIPIPEAFRRNMTG